MGIVLERRDMLPGWIHSLPREMGSFEFGRGFDHLLSGTELTFGVKHLKGIKAITGFFSDVSVPLNIEYKPEEFWDGGRLKMLRGKALMAKKAGPGHVIAPPFVYFAHLRDVRSNKISNMSILLGPVGVNGAGCPRAVRRSIAPLWNVRSVERHVLPSCSRKHKLDAGLAAFCQRFSATGCTCLLPHSTVAGHHL